MRRTASHSNRRHCKLTPAELQTAFINLLSTYGVFSDGSSPAPAKQPGGGVAQKIGVGAAAKKPAWG